MAGFTIAALLVAVAEIVNENQDAIKGFLKENRQTIYAVAKQSKVGIRGAQKEYEWKQAERNKWEENEGGLVRTYPLTPGKNIDDMAMVVCKFFRAYDGTDVSLRTIGDHNYLICCETTSKWSKLAGYNIKCTVILELREDSVDIEYKQYVEESVMQALLKDNAVTGIGKLVCAKDKKELPGELGHAIEKYLEL